MSVEQTPPVTVITVPPEPTTTTSTVPPTTAPPTTVPPTTAPTAVTETTSVPTTVTTPDQPEDGLVLLVFLAVVIAATVVAGLMALVRRQRRTSQLRRIQEGAGSQAVLVERLREVASRASDAEAGPDSPIVGDASVADLYPWIGSPDDLTLVVDLTTAEALTQAGVGSLQELAHLSAAEAAALQAMGIDIDGSVLTAAAEIVLSKGAGKD